MDAAGEEGGHQVRRRRRATPCRTRPIRSASTTYLLPRDHRPLLRLSARIRRRRPRIPVELLLIQTTPDSDGPFVGIVCAPRLEVLGILDLELHGFEIGGTTIRPGMFVRSSAMLPSLNILAVKLCLAI